MTSVKIGTRAHRCQRNGQHKRGAGNFFSDHPISTAGCFAFATFAKMLKYRAEERGKRLPRKSAAALAINSASSRATRLRPPLSLAEPEAKLFKQIIVNCARDHFRQSDLPLLCRYCEASILAERAAQQLREAPVVGGKPSPWLPVGKGHARNGRVVDAFATVASGPR
jgi:hypothetical protein